VERLAPSAVPDASTLRRLGGYIVENRGQVSSTDVRYYVGSGSLHIGFLPSGLVIELPDSSSPPSAASSLLSPGQVPDDDAEPTFPGFSVIRIAFEGSNLVAPRGSGELPSRHNYLSGIDRSKWQVGLRSFREVVYPDLYDRIDLVYRVSDAGLKSEWRVRPGGDPARIRWTYEGITDLAPEGAGLIARTAHGELRDAAPIADQEGRVVTCTYSLSGRSTGFACTPWDPATTLTIDPLLYSTFLGGSQDSRGLSIAVDSAGSAYVTGYTKSSDFPTTAGAYAPTIRSADWDAFVMKLNPSGTGLVYATFLGGRGRDRAFGIAIDAEGNATVTGYTNSSDFPTTPGAFRTTFTSATNEAFIARLSADGTSLLYSTFLGGTVDDRAYALTLDAAGNAYVTGRTRSADFPITPGAFGPTFRTTACRLSVCGHGFISKLSADGRRLLYSSFLGGSQSDRGLAVAVDAAGSAYVTGFTDSADFPVTAGAAGTVFHGGTCGSSPCTDAFVAKVDSAGTSLVYSTFLGGSRGEQAHDIAIDSQGTAYVTGDTNSTDFPVTAGAFETQYRGLAGVDHAFVVHLDAAGGRLLYSTFLGGSTADRGSGLRVGPAGNAFIVGRTNSSDFPTTSGAYDTVFKGGATNDVFVSELDASGSALLYSTFLGGASDDWGNAVTLDAQANVYVTGHTSSSTFPTTPGAFRTGYAGFAQAFVAKLSLAPGPTVRIRSPNAGAVETTSVNVTGTAARATLVQVRVNRTMWTDATGADSWTVTFDLALFPLGTLALEARALNGTIESAHDFVTIQKVVSSPALDRCTVRPDVVAVQVGRMQAFGVSGWNGTTELAVGATWSVSGIIGTIGSSGIFNATAAGVGSVIAMATDGRQSVSCSAQVTVTSGAPPTVAITSPSSGSNATSNTLVVRGTSAQADRVQIRSGTGPWSAVAGTVAYWSAAVDISGFPDGQPLAIEARAFNGTVESTHDRIVLLKSLPLVITISYPADRSQVSGTVIVTGTSTQGSTVRLRFDGGGWQNLTPSGTSWSFRIDTTATFDGDHLIEAQAVLGLLESAILSRDVIVANAKPGLALLSPPLLWGLLLSIPLAALLILAVARRRRRRRGLRRWP